MKKSRIAAFLAAALLAASLTGCGQNAQSSTPETTGEAVVEAEKKVLVTATATDLNTLYPLNMDPQNNVVDRMVYEGLVTYQDNEVKPLLAESWEFQNEGKTIEFKLRQGVVFHDGTPFNAEAVKQCYEHAMVNPNFGGINAAVKIKSIEVVDEHTVAFHYDAPYFAYLKDFCYPEVMIVVSPEVIEKDNFTTMKEVVGTGPYVYEEYKAGEYTRFVKNENYWGEEPYYDEIIVKCIPENSSRLQALKTGEIDMLFGNVLVSYDDYQQAISMDGVEGLIAQANSETRNLVLNAASDKLSDLKVREAIAYAIDKQAISDGLAYGYEVVADKLFDSALEYCDIELNNPRAYDIGKANALLDEAGWILNEATGIREKDGTALSLVYTYDSGETMNESIALVIKDQLKKVGIDVTTTAQDQYTWWMGGIAGEYDITMWNTEQPYTAPHNYFTPMANGSSPHAPSLAVLEGAEEFIAKINEYGTIDDTQRVAQIFEELINYSNDNVLDIPLTYVKDVIVYDTEDISGYDFGSTPMFFEIDDLIPAK